MSDNTPRVTRDPDVELDIDFIRSQFPAFSHPDAAGWAHLENAGGSYVPRQVIDILTHFYTATKVQPYVAAGPSTAGGRAMDRAYEMLPATFNAADGEVHFGPSTSQNTYVLAHAIRAIMNEGDQVIVTNQDHEANIGPWRRLAQTGIAVGEWQVDPDTGLLDVKALESLLTDRTRLVCVTHASNIAATFNPISEIADLVHAAGAWLLVDGVAYAPHRAVDVQSLGCDAYLYSTYKTYGPHLGLMYTSDDLLSSVANQGHYFNEDKATSRLTPAGPNHAAVASSAGIVDYYQAVHAHHFGDNGSDPVTAIASVFDLFGAQEEKLMSPILDFLSTKDVRVIGSLGSDRGERAPTISFCSDRMASRDVWSALGDQRIAAGHGNFYAKRLVETLGIDPEDGVVRLSLVHYNTTEEVQRAIDVLDRVL